LQSLERDSDSIVSAVLEHVQNLWEREPWRMSILLQLPNGLSSKVCICACRALGILERELGAHDRRVGEAMCALARIRAAKGQSSTLTDSYGSLIVTSIR
jgi:hypothetical protein